MSKNVVVGQVADSSQRLREEAQPTSLAQKHSNTVTHSGINARTHFSPDMAVLSSSEKVDAALSSVKVLSWLLVQQGQEGQTSTESLCLQCQYSPAGTERRMENRILKSS